MPFKKIISDSQILKAIEESGYTVPTPIQESAIPEILKGNDILASANTGTGKTAAFLLPCLTKLSLPPINPVKGPRILVLAPTRELAMQVAKEATKYSKHMTKVKTVCIYGGASYPQQNKELSRPYEILVATPGRLIDHLERGRVNLSRVETLILDEADRMLDMGFIEAVEEIAAKTPKNRQTLMFSATLKKNVLKLAQNLLVNPIEISTTTEIDKHDHIEQRLLMIDNINHKYKLLDHILADETLGQAIIFTSTKQHADHLAEKLQESGQKADVLHGGLRQRQRERTIMQLRKGFIRVLVATDVAARGIDIPAISHVINFDLPLCPEDYVHRIGRTGRAGASGLALSFAGNRDRHLLGQIEKFIGKKITPTTIPGLEPTPAPVKKAKVAQQQQQQPSKSFFDKKRKPFIKKNKKFFKKS